MIRHWKAPVVIPVVHVTSVDQARRNLELLERKSVPSCFLINQGKNDLTPDEMWGLVYHGYDMGMNVGVNILGGRSPLTYRTFFDDRFSQDRFLALRALWVDDVDNMGHVSGYVQKLEHLLTTKIVTFGGVGFKYCSNQDIGPKRVWEASRQVDVVTTSGDATGSPPTVDKVFEIRKYLPYLDFFNETPRLAVASGVNADNIRSLYMHGADTFIVASSIESSFGVFDPDKLDKLLEAQKGIMVSAGFSSV